MFSGGAASVVRCFQTFAAAGVFFIAPQPLTKEEKFMKENTKVLRLVESGLLLAIATVLSLIKLLDMPYGGSVTACSDLPILLIAYRYGTGWGLFSSLVYSLLQLALGASTLSYCTTPLSVVAVILLDYVLAFAVYGLGGVFRKEGRSQGQALVLGALLVQGLRFVCHVISGCTVWAGLSIPTNAALIYSIGYNATYMLPELLVTMLGAWYFSRAVDVSGQRPTRAAANQGNPVLGVLYPLTLVATVVTDILLIFAHLQNADDGSFTFAGLSEVNWTAAAIVTAAGLLATLVLYLLDRKQKAVQA